MARKRKLTPREKAEKKRRRELYEYVFIHGKQKRIRKEPQVDGIPRDEWLAQNAGPIELHGQGLWHLIENEPEDTFIDDELSDIFA